MSREKSTVHRCQAIAKKFGAWQMKTQSGAYGGRAGLPDLILCYRGLFIGVECKKRGERPSEIQLREHELIRRAGGICIVVEEPLELARLLERLRDEVAS